MIKQSINKRAHAVKSLEVIDGTKFIGRIYIRNGKSFNVIKGDKIIVVRRKKMIEPK